MVSEQKINEIFGAQFQIFMDTIDDLAIIINPKEDFKIEYLNLNSTLDSLGYSDKDLTGQSLLSITHPDDKKKLIKYFKKGNEQRDSKQEIRLNNYQELAQWFEIKQKKFKMDKETDFIFILLKDITRRKNLEKNLQDNTERFKKITETIPEIRFWKLFNPKKYEEALQSSYEMLQMVMENIPQYIIWKDTDLSYLGFNDNYANLIGIDHPENIIGKKDGELLNSTKNLDEDQILYNQVQEEKVIQSNKPKFHSIEYWTLKNGDKIWIDSNRIPLNDSDGNVVGLLITFEDITERKKAQEELQKEHDKLERIMETNPAGIISVDKYGIINYVNSQAEKVLQFPKEQLTQLSIKTPKFKLYTPTGRSIPEKDRPFQYIMRTKESLIDYHVTFELPNEGRILISINATPLTDTNGEVVNIIFTVEDITERELAKLQIKESEEKYRHLIESSPISILLFDWDGKVIDVNSTTQKLFGYEREDFVGKNSNELPLYPPEIFDVIGEKLKKIVRRKEVEPTELQIYKKDGSLAWVNTQITTLKLGDKTYFQAIAEDITEQKNSEQLLKHSEERYRDLLETSTVGILEINLENQNVTYVNPKLLDIIGYGEIELETENFLQRIIHPDDINKILKSTEERELDFRLVTKDEKIKWLKGKRINQYDSEENLISFRLWMEDVTETKMYEELIYELNINFLNFTADIQKNIEMLLKTCLKLLDGKLVLYVNRSYHEDDVYYRIITSEGEIYTYDEKEFEENLLVKEFLKENHDFTQEFYDVDKTEYAETDEFVKKHKIKAIFGKLIMSETEFNDMLCVLYQDNPEITNQNKLVLFLICDAIEIEQRRWQALQHLEEQSRLKSDLFSRASHELKTPLISIKGFTDLLLMNHAEKFDAEVLSILNEIKDGGQTLHETINDIIHSSQLEQGLQKINKTKQNLGVLIKSCVRKLQGSAEKREQQVKIEMKHDIETNYDIKQIQIVINNLLLNAIKYTPIGGKIAICSEVSDSQIIVSVKDNGIGITSDEKKKLFTQFGKIERYGQGWNLGSEGTEGTGVGLYNSKKIIDLHQGKIWFESLGRNKGTTFYFSLPIVKS